MTTTPRWGSALALAFALAGWGAVSTPTHAQEEPSAEELLRSLDDLYRGRTSASRMRIHVKTDRYERTLRLETFTQGEEKTLLRVEAPEKEQGTTTLMVEGDIYNYLPKVDRTMKVPAAMMSSSWMGSHLTNDDLVQESRYSDDYTCDFKSRASGRDDVHVISCKPKPDAPVVWGEVVVRLRASDNLPVEERFYDERGELVRTITFSDVKELGGRRIPTRMTVVPADKPNERTVLVIEELALDVPLDEGMFTLEHLRAGRGRAPAGSG